MTVTSTLGSYTLPGISKMTVSENQAGNWITRSSRQIVFRKLTTAYIQRTWNIEMVCRTSAEIATVRSAFSEATDAVKVFKPPDTATTYNVRAYGKLDVEPKWLNGVFYFNIKFSLQESVPT